MTTVKDDMKTLIPLILLLSACAIPPSRQNFEASDPVHSQTGDQRLWGSLGKTSSPDAFFIGGQLDIYIHDDLAIGPRLQVALDGNTEILAPSFNVKKVFPIAGEGRLSRWKPYAQGGVGIAYVHKDLPPGRDDHDVALLLHVGGGVEFFLNEGISMGAGLDINFLPGDAVGESAFVTWRLFEMGFIF